VKIEFNVCDLKFVLLNHSDFVEVILIYIYIYGPDCRMRSSQKKGTYILDDQYLIVFD